MLRPHNLEVMVAGLTIRSHAWWPALVLFLLPGCTSSDETVAKWFADPAKFEFHSCEQLVVALAAATKERDRLYQLIVRAEQERSGKLVSAVAYKSDHLEAVASVQMIEAKQKEKNCLNVEQEKKR